MQTELKRAKMQRKTTTKQEPPGPQDRVEWRTCRFGCHVAYWLWSDPTGDKIQYNRARIKNLYNHERRDCRRNPDWKPRPDSKQAHGEAAATNKRQKTIHEEEHKRQTTIQEPSCTEGKEHKRHTDEQEHQDEAKIKRDDRPRELGALMDFLSVPPVAAPRLRARFALQVLSEQAARARAAIMASRPEDDLVVRSGPETLAGGLTWLQVVREYLAAEAGNRLPHKSMYWLPHLEPRTIGPEDDRVKLRGQQGLFAKRGVRKGSVFGHYLCWVQFDDEADSVYAPASELDFIRYSLEFSSQVEAGRTLIGSAFGDMANALRLVNDARVDPTRPRSSDAVRRREQRRKNVEWAEICYRGWPFVFHVARRDIKRDEELTTDYGPLFWDNIGEAESRNSKLLASLQQMQQWCVSR